MRFRPLSVLILIAIAFIAGVWFERSRSPWVTVSSRTGTDFFIIANTRTGEVRFYDLCAGLDPEVTRPGANAVG
ncbi:MAG: hypothetical protein MI923_00070 [Phycisphaerales bacterium]|nr:hypothetical protein [Phycisphaerales bacterium]